MMHNLISADNVIIPAHQREVNLSHVERIATKMRKRGYNPSYPITLNRNKELVDGGHRLAAAKSVGIGQIPYIEKPDGVPDALHAIRCNEDGADTKRYDVFDFAHHCWARQQQGYQNQEIATELGWSSAPMVTYHLNIKSYLHPDAWSIARNGLTKNDGLVNDVLEGVVNSELTVVNWKERHFRALLTHLRYTDLDDDQPDEILANEQITAIQIILNRFQGKDTDRHGKPHKVTASWIEEVAKKYAWFASLKKYALANIREWVTEEARQTILNNVEKGLFGVQEAEDQWQRFKDAIDALNGKMPRLHVGRAEKMDFLDDGCIDLIITSPPYNLGKDNMPMGGDGRTPRENGIGYDQHGDNMPEDKYQAWQLECLKEMFRVASDGASLFYNHKVRSKDGKAIHPIQWLGQEENPWTLRQEIVWDRGSTHNHSAVLFWPEDERIYWLTKGKPIIDSGSIGKSTVWKEHGPIADTWHPAPFTPELPRMCMEAIGRKNITVLDPFAGSCTTIKVATSEYGYDAVGVDISGEYLDKAKEKNGWTKISES